MVLDWSGVNNRLIYGLTLYSTLGAGLMAGVYFAFSVAVMPALDRLPGSQAIAAMNHINKVIVNPVFMLAFLVATLTSAVVGVYAAVQLDGHERAWLIAGAALFVVGSFLITIGYHVPKNDALGEIDPNAVDAARVWADYLREWLPMNHVRALTTLGSLASFVMAFRVA
jgi:uncharacterized membrane protein